MGRSVFIWRNSSRRIGLRIVTSLNEHFVEVRHKERMRSSAYQRTRPALSGHASPPLRPLAGHTVSDEKDVEDDSTHLKLNQPQAVESSSSRSCQRRTEPERLISEDQRLITDLPEKRHFRTTHQISYMTSSTQTKESGCLRDKHAEDEKRQAFNIEMQSWINAKTFGRVSNATTALSSNVIESHFIYKCKPDGIPKARIVPWVNRDLEKNNFRGDATFFHLDYTRLLFSLAVELRCFMREMDVTSAYL